MKEQIATYKAEVAKELKNVLDYWMKFTVDKKHGGFVGKINHDNSIHPEAPKGAVLNSRILWSFSAAYNYTKNDDYLAMAYRSCDYLIHYFIDKEHGGVYWTVNYKGEPLDTKKQIYALSFAIYGLSEYYIASNKEEVKQAAIDLYLSIIEHSYDNVNGGYLEALSRDWKELGDLRLSAKDANEKKTMNTHLHVLEAFANLYRIWPDSELKEKLIELIRLFLDRIISKEDHHLILFFDDKWEPKSGIISYGHDVEAAWLIQEAAELMDDDLLLKEVKAVSVQLAKSAVTGLDSDGGLWYEYEPEQRHLIKQKHWWPQAEAMVGFFNAWELTGDEEFLKHSLHSWEFIKDKMIDKKGGEWIWGVDENGALMKQEDKVGIWKCPYHNSRGCMEIIRRIDSLSTKRFQ